MLLDLDVRKMYDSLGQNIENLREARHILIKCTDILQEYDMRFFMSQQESKFYLTTVDKLLDKAILILKKVIE